jgi:predicted Zn-dependent protease
MAGCATPAAIQNMGALDQPGETYLVDERERRLIGEADEYHQELVGQGLIYREPEANAYVNRIADAVLPDLHTDAIRYRVFILKDASINAFAFPNGNIYLNAGLIVRLDSEAKLAHVIAHEGAHVVHRHSYKGLVDRKSAVAGARLADVLLLGTGLSYVATVTHMSSFSREMESEADLEALRYLADTDYSIQDSVGVFRELKEVKHDKEGASIWSSHPENSRRLADGEAYIAAHAAVFHGQQTFAQRYEAFRQPLAELAFRLRLLQNNFELAGDIARSELERQGDSARWRCNLGEAAYRTAAFPDAAAREHVWLYGAGDAEAVTLRYQSEAPANLRSAEASFREALALDPDYARAKRGLGLVAYREGRRREALALLEAYLSSPGIPDRKYIESIIKKLNKQGA